MSARQMAAALAFPLLLGATGCAATDPLLQEGLWRPIGANEANLRLMVAVPSDLIQGVAAPGADGHGAARAAQRLRQDLVKPLPNTAISKLAPIGAAAAPAAPPPSASAEGG